MLVRRQRRVTADDVNVRSFFRDRKGLTFVCRCYSDVLHNLSCFTKLVDLDHDLKYVRGGILRENPGMEAKYFKYPTPSNRAEMKLVIMSCFNTLFSILPHCSRKKIEIGLQTFSTSIWPDRDFGRLQRRSFNLH